MALKDSDASDAERAGSETDAPLAYSEEYFLNSYDFVPVPDAG